MHLSITHKKPISNGIITCNNKKQAQIRSSFSKKNKGEEATKAVLNVLGIYKNDSKWRFCESSCYYNTKIIFLDSVSGVV